MPRQIASRGVFLSSAIERHLRLERVARGGDVVERRVRRLAEARRVHVAAAREQDRVEAAHEALEGGLRELGRQEHGHAARLLDGVEVGRVDVGALGSLVRR